MTARIYITDVGKQVALSGLLPETADSLLYYVAKHGTTLATHVRASETPQAEGRNIFDFAMIFACLASPEFSSSAATRFLHYTLGDYVANPMLDKCVMLLSQVPWQPYRNCGNAADLLLGWINGLPIEQLEERFPGLRAGKIQGMAREAAWCLAGFAEILAAATRPDIATEERPLALKHLPSDALAVIRTVIPSIRLLVWRLVGGFPAEVLWMSEVKDTRGRTLVTRTEALSLLKVGLHGYNALRQRANWRNMIDALLKGGIREAQASAKKIQEGANTWHAMRRKKTQEKLLRQAPQAAEALNLFFDGRELEFQRAVEELLTAAKIRFTLFDNGTRPGAFDYLIHIDERSDFVIECKTKQGEGLVDMNEARTVLGAAIQYGYDNAFCVTLCNPGINPDVVANFADCSRLAIAEAQDVAVALTRVITGKLSPQGFHDWLTQPGLARADNIYAHSRHAETVAATILASPVDNGENLKESLEEEVA